MSLNAALIYGCDSDVALIDVQDGVSHLRADGEPVVVVIPGP